MYMYVYVCICMRMYMYMYVYVCICIINEIDMPRASSNQGMKRRGLWLLVLRCCSSIELSWHFYAFLKSVVSFLRKVTWVKLWWATPGLLPNMKPTTIDTRAL